MVQILELAVAALLIAGAIWSMRRTAPDGVRGGNQGAVILLVIGGIVAIHGLGLMNYRPSPAETEARG